MMNDPLGNLNKVQDDPITTGHDQSEFAGEFAQLQLENAAYQFVHGGGGSLPNVGRPSDQIGSAVYNSSTGTGSLMGAIALINSVTGAHIGSALAGTDGGVEYVTYSDGRTMVVPSRNSDDYYNYQDESGTWNSGRLNQGGDYPGQVNYHGYTISSPELRADLLQFSQYIGRPTNITSGDRSAARNRAAGGANASRHLFGDAADMSVAGLTNRELAILANQSDLFNTVIYYPIIDATGGLRPHTHVDLNPSHDNLFLIYTPVINNGVVTQNSYSPFK